MRVEAAAGSASAFFQCVNQAGPGALQRRINSHGQAGQDRQCDGEPKDWKGETHARLGIEGQKVRCHFRYERHQLRGQQCADYPGENAHEQTFENEKSQHARPGSSQRHAQRDLSPPASEAHKKKVRYVATRYQQHERHRAKQSSECRPQISRHIFGQRFQRHDR